MLERVWRKGNALHCWWECKLLQPLLKVVWRFLKNLEIKPPYDPAFPLLGIYPAAAASKSLQSCLTLWDPIDSSLPGSLIPGILQAQILEWVVIAFTVMMSCNGHFSMKIFLNLCDLV